MPILISHTSSLERLRSIPPQVDRAVLVEGPLPLAPFAQSGGPYSEQQLRKLGLMQRPVHCLVPQKRHASPGEAVRVHRCQRTELPAGLVRRIDENAYCAGPELTFIQMADRLTPIGTVVLGHELCGTYAHFSQMISGFYERPALTSVKLLYEAIGQLRGMHGLGAARKALGWIRDGSASPMETVIAAMLVLPTKLGGFGLVAPELNYEVELDLSEARIAGVKLPRIDTAYPSVHVGVEFDGKEYHRDAEHDRKRREALAHKGWTIYVLNVDELASYRKLKEKVALLDAVPRQRGQGPTTDAATADLLRRLLAATRCGIGLNEVLFGAQVPRGAVKVHL